MAVSGGNLSIIRKYGMLVKFNYMHSNTANLVVAIYTTLVFSHKRQGKDSK